MAVSKTFAIEADASTVWDALWAEVAGPETAEHTVESAHRPQSLVIALSLGGLPTRLEYTIESRDSGCEVTAVLEPLSVRYRLLQIVTLGRMHLNYELVLAQGLSNLKTAVEAKTR